MNQVSKPAVFEDSTGVSAREFVRIWQSSNSLTEVAKQLKRTKNAVRVRAFRYREMGVPLKVFPVVEVDVIDWNELAQFAESFELR
jgi:hypothetical protein